MRGGCGERRAAVGSHDGLGSGKGLEKELHISERKWEPTWVLEPGCWETRLTAPPPGASSPRWHGPGPRCDLHQGDLNISLSHAPILLTEARTPPLHMNDCLPQRGGAESLLRGLRGASFSPAAGPLLGFGDVTASHKSAVWLLRDQVTGCCRTTALSNALAPQPERSAGMWGCSWQARKGFL